MFVGNRGDIFGGEHGADYHNGLVFIVFEGSLVMGVHDSSSKIFIAWQCWHIRKTKMTCATDNVIELLNFL